jgi:FixJ family two-component response regulator
MDALTHNVPLIAIIDDDESMRRVLTRLMRSRGFATQAFVSAEAFLQSIAVRDASCLICDVHMPGINGLELQTRMAAENLPVPIIFITAFHDSRTQWKALEAGALCFLKKPFSAKELVACVERALSSSAI